MYFALFTFATKYEATDCLTVYWAWSHATQLSDWLAALVTGTETLLLPTWQKVCQLSELKHNAMTLQRTWLPQSEESRPPGYGWSDGRPGGWSVAARQKPAPRRRPALTRQGGCRLVNDWRPPTAAADRKWPHRNSGEKTQENGDVICPFVKVRAMDSSHKTSETNLFPPCAFFMSVRKKI